MGVIGLFLVLMPAAGEGRKHRPGASLETTANENCVRRFGTAGASMRNQAARHLRDLRQANKTVLSLRLPQHHTSTRMSSWTLDGIIDTCVKIGRMPEKLPDLSPLFPSFSASRTGKESLVGQVYKRMKQLKNFKVRAPAPRRRGDALAVGAGVSSKLSNRLMRSNADGLWTTDVAAEKAESTVTALRNALTGLRRKGVQFKDKTLNVIDPVGQVERSVRSYYKKHPEFDKHDLVDGFIRKYKDYY